MQAAIYARVSTYDQDCSLQLTELRNLCSRNGWAILEYVEKASGKAGSRRPVLEKLMQDARMRRFDLVLVWKLDRFGRSVHELVSRIQDLDRAGIRFMAPNQGVDTDQRNPGSRLMLHILSAVAEFERDLIQERVVAGVREAQRRGKHCGRPKLVFDRGKAGQMRSQGLSWRQIALRLGVPQSTIRRGLKTAA